MTEMYINRLLSSITDSKCITIEIGQTPGVKLCVWVGLLSLSLVESVSACVIYLLLIYHTEW